MFEIDLKVDILPISHFIQRMSFIPNIKYKTEYCLYWQDGKYCEKGTHCFFAHGPQELRTIEENHQEIMARSSQSGEGPAKPYNYKTIFCKFYAEGQCKLGEKCTYAHERREKRKKKMSQEYKLSSKPNQQGWTQAQIQEYYNQLYYYQMYQANPQAYQFPGHGFQQHAPQLSPPQQPHPNTQLELVPQDINISPEIKPDFAEINNSRQDWGAQKVQSPGGSHVTKSPQSGETEAACIKINSHFELLESSTEFKENE